MRSERPTRRNQQQVKALCLAGPGAANRQDVELVRQLHALCPVSAIQALLAACLFVERWLRTDESISAVHAAVAAWLAELREEDRAAVATAAAAAPHPTAGRYQPPQADAALFLAEAVRAPVLSSSLERFVGGDTAWAPGVDDTELEPGDQQGLIGALHRLSSGLRWNCQPYQSEEEIGLAMSWAMRDSLLGASAPRPTIEPARRFAVRSHVRSHGDLYELEEDTTFWILDLSDLSVLARFEGGSWARYDGGGWDYQGSEGVLNVTISADGGHAEVRLSSGRVEKLSLPGR